MWLRGQKVDIIQDLIDTFLRSDYAKVLVTSEVIDSEDVDLFNCVQCNFSGSSNSMKMNIYYKNKKEKRAVHNQESTLDKEIEKAFQTHAFIHNLAKERKEEYIHDYILKVDKKKEVQETKSNPECEIIDMTKTTKYEIIDLTDEN